MRESAGDTTAGGSTAGRPPDYWSQQRQPTGRRPHRGRRLLLRLAGFCLVLLLLGLAAFGGLLLATPSVAGAWQLARATSVSHHSAFPGPAVPPRFTAALEATEDHRFNEEPGIDPIAILRVIEGHITRQGDEGGATLYQQLAKMLYTPGRQGLAVEAEQVALAVKLKFSFTGPQILRMYADVAYFGHGFYGLNAASCGYFGVQPAGLSWPQAALLAGLVQAPSLDDPLRYPVQARIREEHVVSRLVATGALSPAQASAALQTPVPDLVAPAGQGCAP